MALTVVTPDGLDITGNYLFNGLNVAGNLVTGNATVTGNLIVNGDTIYANVTTLNVKDPIIEQGGNPNGSPLTTNDSKDRGSLLHYYTSAPIDAFMGWDTSNAEFSFGSNVTLTNNVVTFNTLGNVRADYFLGNGSQLTGVIAASATTAGTANTANTVTNNSQPNITSVGTLSSLTVTGNITAGNVSGANAISANFFVGDGGLLTNIAGGGATNAISSGNSNVTVDANSTVRISVSGTSNVVVVSNTVTTITGDANVTGNLIAGNISAGTGTGGNITGANLISANYFTGTLTTSSQPNITSVGSLTDLTVTGNATLGNISGNGAGISNIAGANVTGTVANATNATLATSATSATVSATVTTNAQPNITSVGTLTSLDVTGNVSGNYFIGNGSLLTGLSAGTTNSIVNGNSNVVVDANANIRISAVGNANVVVVTGTGLNVTGEANISGNLTAGNISTGAGSGGSITGGNLLSANYVTGTLTTGAQPNITSVGTLSNLLVTGNITGANTITANYFVGNFYGTANSAVTATTATSATIAATVTTNAQPNITSVGTLSSLDVTGNVSGNYFIGNGSLLTGITGGGTPNSVVNGTSNIIVELNSNVLIGASGNANIVVVTGTGAIINGTANITGNLTAGNISTGAGSGGSITGGNLLSANYITGTLTTTAQPNITSVGNLSALTVAGNLETSNANLGNAATANYFVGNLYGTANSAVSATTATSATIAATVTGNAQSNITSVGTLTSLDVTGNAQFSGANVSLGSVGNLKITGGTADYVLRTDGTGNLSWVEQSGGSPSTATTDYFTGNGVANSFTLSVTPASKDWTVVNYNGVLVLRNDYSLVGNVIAFNNAPADSAEIEVTSISVSSIGGGGSSGSTAASVGYSLIFGG